MGYSSQKVRSSKKSEKHKKRKQKHGAKHINYWWVKNNWGEYWGVGGYGNICMMSSLPSGTKSLLSSICANS